MAGGLTANLDKVFKTLLILDSLRGEDSTGALLVSRFDGKATVAKQLGDPFCLFNDHKFDTAFRKINRVMLGHNRFATSGGVSKVSAHPFENASLVGVHNGTLINKHKLEDSSDFKVDSENLYHHIDKLGLDSALQVMEGAWALVWWNKKGG
jgi:glucosamine 6-phosphate synthetase-like amidotransferase/phosphosugar isomerase protein